MAQYPSKLQELLDDFETITDRNERAELLIEIADRFREVKVQPEVATLPYPEERRVPACESEAFVWPVEDTQGKLHFQFDVLNPQGLSARAMSVILEETLGGEDPAVIAQVPQEIVFKLFGNEISMGKGAGLMGIIQAVKFYANQKQSAS